MFKVKRAEDFYLSLGLPPMTDKFWNKSVFSRENNETKCHGTAADMFKTGDFRFVSEMYFVSSSIIGEPLNYTILIIIQ